MVLNFCIYGKFLISNNDVELAVKKTSNLFFSPDIDECAAGDVCGKGRCQNYWGSFYCFCDRGYKPCQKTRKCIG